MCVCRHARARSLEVRKEFSVFESHASVWQTAGLPFQGNYRRGVQAITDICLVGKEEQGE